MIKSGVNPLDFLILVVDDAKPNVVLLSHILEQEGFKVDKCYDGDEALEHIEKKKPDLILMDIKMPTMSGIEVGKELKRIETEDIPIIFLSSTNETIDKVQAFEAGGVDFVNKPFDKDELLMRIRNHLMLTVLKKETERQVQVLKEREAELSKINKEKHQLLRMLSHDIKNPLSGIMGLISILTTDDELEEADKEEMLELIKDSSESLLSVVKEVLDKNVSKKEFQELQTEEYDLVVLADEVMTLNSAKATLKKIDLQIESTDPEFFYEIDKPKLFDALNILVSNSIRFTTSGGTVGIKIEPDEEAVLIKVFDDGIGIPNEILDNFLISSDRDKKLDSKHSYGSELGLDEVKQYVVSHDGKIWVQSEEKVGTTFFIELPLAN